MGELGLGVRDGVVRAVRFEGVPREDPSPAVEAGVDDAAVLAEAAAQLRAYLAGELTDFELPAAPAAGVAFDRGSDFERAVWARIAAIPYGETASYGEIARAVGTPTGIPAGAPTGPGQLARGVGTACNRNPTPVIVACHRVIGADGKLVGFGGGLHRKRWLLALEARVHIERSFAF